MKKDKKIKKNKMIKKNKEIEKNKGIKVIIEILETIFAAFVMGVGISMFLLPNQLSTGGISGIATITYYLFKVPMGKMMLYINIPLFLFSGYKIGKKFLLKTIVGTTSLSLFIDILDRIPPLTQDKFLASIYGGILVGISTAVLLKINSSTGGTDLISYLIKKYKPEIRSGNVIILLDIVIIGINMIVFKQIEIGLYSTISIYIMGKIIDLLFEGTFFTKTMIIVSDKNEEISDRIEKEIQRGVTGLYGKGMYTGEEKLILVVAATRNDMNKIKIMARNIDEKSFIIISNSKEVVGKGFKE